MRNSGCFLRRAGEMESCYGEEHGVVFFDCIG